MVLKHKLVIVGDGGVGASLLSASQKSGREVSSHGTNRPLLSFCTSPSLPFTHIFTPFIPFIVFLSETTRFKPFERRFNPKTYF
jgi:hypothetical protein